MPEASQKKQEQYETQVGRLARGAGLNTFGQGIGRILGYATQVALARMYGPSLSGLYALGATLIMMAGLLSQLGMNQGVLRWIPYYRSHGDTARVRGTILLALCAVFSASLVLTVLIFFGAGFLADTVFNKPSADAVCRAFAVSLPFFAITTISVWITQGFHTQRYALIEQIQRSLINLVLIVVFYFLGAQIMGAVAAFVLSTAAGAVLAVRGLKRMFPMLLDRSIPPKFEPRTLFSVSIPMIVANFAERANSWSMLIVAGVFVTSENLGIFNAASRTALLSSLVLWAFNAFTPIVASLYGRGEHEDLNRLCRDVSRWSLTGSLAIFLLTSLLAKDIMAIFGPEFISGWVVLLIISTGELFNSSTGPSNRILAMTGHQGIVMLTTVGSATTTLILGLVLIPRYGITGAGVSTAIGLVASNIVSLFYLKRLLGLWLYSLGSLKPLAAGLLTAAGAYGVSVMLPLHTGIPTIVVIAPVFLASFTSLMLVFGLYPSDRQLIDSLWKAVLRRAQSGA